MDLQTPLILPSHQAESVDMRAGRVVEEEEEQQQPQRTSTEEEEEIRHNEDVGGVVPAPAPAPSRMASSSHPPVVPWYSNPMQVSAMISNFSTSYNVVNISLVIPILAQISTSSSGGGGGESDEDEAALASSLLAGMVVGQLLGGALGDIPRLGRIGALRLVMLLQIVASLGSAFCSDGGEVYVELSIWRFILGIGAGGVYPLSAVLSAEQSGVGAGGANSNHHGSAGESLHRVVLTFSMQGLGFLAVPLVAVPLLYTVPNLDLIWRVIVGVGCVPGIILMSLQWRVYRRQLYGLERHVLPTEANNEHDHNDQPTAAEANEEESGHRHHSFDGDEDAVHNPQIEAANSTGGIVRATGGGDADGGGGMPSPEGGIRPQHGWCDSIRHEEDLVRKLLGTACTWFLFDVLFYGNTLFEPIVIESAFGARETPSNPLHLLQRTALDSLLLTSIALPGYAVAGLALGNKSCGVSQTPRFVMLQGFAMMSVLYLTVGIGWNDLRRFPMVLVVLYSLTFFFANYGPVSFLAQYQLLPLSSLNSRSHHFYYPFCAEVLQNTTTFVLPSLIYSAECRSTFNGISAAAGKTGALVGATVFAPAADAFGDASVMIICSVVAILAFILTKLFVRVQSDDENR